MPGSVTAAATTDSRRSWTTSGLAFTAMFVAVGIGYAYGALLLPLTRDLLIDPGTVSGVFSVTVVVFFLAGAPAGMLTDRWGPRVVLLLGALALSGGLVLTSAAQGPVLLYLGHGLLVGGGMATTFVPLIAVVSASFVRHRSVAVGVAVSGIGIGTLVMAPLVAWLITGLGWRPAYLLLAVVGGVVMLVAALLMPPRERSASVPLRDATALGGLLRTRDYRLLYAAQVLLAVALFMPFAHLPAYGETSGSSAVAAAGLVGVIGAASVVGRLALGLVAGRLGLLLTYQGCFLTVALSFVPWLWSGGGYPFLLAHALLFGVGYGGFVALLPGVVAERFGLQQLGGLIGILYTSNAIGAGLGPLAAGLLVEQHGYAPAGWAGLVCGLLAVIVLGRIRKVVA